MIPRASVADSAYAGEVRSILFDSPVSRAGYLYATLVGLIWGAVWSTGRIERRGGLVVFRGMPTWAFGRGGSCVGGCYLTNQNVTDRILEHEAVHKRQWQRFGLVFPLLYLVAGRNPLRNRYEIEAGLDKGGYLAQGEHR